MYAMNNEKERKMTKKRRVVRSAKECAYLAVFVALVIAVQVVLFAVPGVELVTVLFVAYAFVFGTKRGMAAATAFSLLRQIVFGISPTVLTLYLLYFNGLAATFGAIGRRMKDPIRMLPSIVLTACVCTVGFTMLDNVLTPLWYGYSQRATEAYFYASLSFMIPQVACAALSVWILFLPLRSAFAFVKKGLQR